MRAPLILLVLPLLAACQLALPGKGKDVPSANPITVGAVQVTSLDAPPATTPATPPAMSAATPRPVAAAPPQPAAQAAAPTAAAAPGPDPAAMPAEAIEVPAVRLSPEALACKAQGGFWGRVGDTAAFTCFRQTRDAGKSCRRQTDCETECLARSRTCAPITPLFGCNPVLQADGREVNLCID